MHSIEESIQELHKGFHLLNKSFFCSELPEPAILIQNQGNRKNVLGWCTTKEIWSDEDGSVKKYEINITAEFLNRDYMDVMETMLHEMVHLYNAVNGVQDCSRSGAYHNKKFKAEAERRGLKVEFARGSGWAFTSLEEETKDEISTYDINQQAFKLSRGFPDKKKGSNVIKWECPHCDLIIRSTKEVKVLCGECLVELIKSF